MLTFKNLELKNISKHIIKMYSKKNRSLAITKLYKEI